MIASPTIADLHAEIADLNAELDLAEQNAAVDPQLSNEIMDLQDELSCVRSLYDDLKDAVDDYVRGIRTRDELLQHAVERP